MDNGIFKGMARVLIPMLCLLLLSCRKADETKWSEAQLRAIWFPPKLMVTSQDLVRVEGHWKQIRFGLITRIPVLNAVSITCLKGERVCTESRSELYSPLDNPPMFSENLRLSIEPPEEYKIQSWSSDGTILATYETDTADWELRISVKDRTAEKSYRETRARGSKTSDPTVVHTWVLE